MLEFSVLKATPPVHINFFTTIKTYLSVVLTSTYFFYAPFFYVLFWINVEVVILVVDNFFPSALANSALLFLFENVAFIPNFIYFSFMQALQQGYTDGERFYLSYLEKLELISLVCSEQLLRTVGPILEVLVELGDQLRGEQLPVSYDVLDPKSSAVAELTLVVHDMPRPERMRYLLSDLRQRAPPGDYALGIVGDLLSTQQSVERSGYISDPPFVTNQNTLLLIAWYSIWLPFTFYARAGRGPTILLYPFVAMILWAPAILRLWLGDAWSPNRPYENANEHETWPEKFKQKIRNNIAMRLRLIDAESAKAPSQP